MRRLNLLFIFLLLIGLSACSGFEAPPNNSVGGMNTPTCDSSIVLNWKKPKNNSPLPTTVIGYRIFYGTVPFLHMESVDVAGANSLTYKFHNLCPQTYYFDIAPIGTNNQASISIGVLFATVNGQDVTAVATKGWQN